MRESACRARTGRENSGKDDDGLGGGKLPVTHIRQSVFGGDVYRLGVEEERFLGVRIVKREALALKREKESGQRAGRLSLAPDQPIGELIDHNGVGGAYMYVI